MKTFIATFLMTLALMAGMELAEKLWLKWKNNENEDTN